MPSPPFGVGFRTEHFADLVAGRAAVDCLEVLSDNFIGIGGPRRGMLERLRADYPIVLHGIGLSIAGVDPLSEEYLEGLRALAEWLQPAWVSDHLCWTALGRHESHDLLPVACTAEVLDHVAGRVDRVQDFLGRRLLLENATAYVAFRDQEMGEAEFLAALCRRTGCGVLLDVNNLYVNAMNLGVDAAAYLDALEPETVAYMHLAGHAVLPDVRIDTHDADVPAAVWDLFGTAVRRFRDAGVIIERDDNLPALVDLIAEVDRARARHVAAIAATRQAGGIPHSARPELVEGRVECLQPAANQWSQLQREFWARVAGKPAGFDHRTDTGLGAFLEDTLPVAAARGMQVYSDAYAVSLRRALAVNFPALARVVTAADFERLAAEYLGRHPPRHHDFRRLGSELAAFVRSHRFAADYGVAAAALADLAALEQAQLEVQDEIDEAAGIAPECLAAVAPDVWEGLRVEFVRALRLVRASHDVLPVAEAVGRSENPDRPAVASVAYLVYRAGGKVCTERIGPAVADVLEALLAGHSFGSACAAVAGNGADETDVAVEAARVLVQAAARGLVKSLEIRAG
jgi:uncharacterized protein (UPF0276 family)